MSGYARAILIFSFAAFVLYAMLTFSGVPWCTPLLAVVLGISTGFIAANMQGDDPAKTARITRNGAKAGAIAGVFGALGQVVGGYLALSNIASVDMNGVLAPAATAWVCLGGLALLVFTFSGGVGGWSWARHEHERQTGYKPT